MITLWKLGKKKIMYYKIFFKLYTNFKIKLCIGKIYFSKKKVEPFYKNYTGVFLKKVNSMKKVFNYY